ncbi:MAG TPA: CBS domain-containing protein [Rickettsiales bacterium]|nr:CBS domain-containing protein [Rickettsiales bacterium]
MLVKDIMTRKVVAVAPEATTQDIAKLLMQHHISAVPVVDADGRPLGIVSEGDLTGRNIIKDMERREWWLDLLAEGNAVAPDFLQSLKARSRCARELMATPVITVDGNTDVSDVAKLLTEHHIKRVPVVENGEIIGIVSRADLVRALTLQAGKAEHHGFDLGQYIFEAFDKVDKHFHEYTHPPEQKHEQDKTKASMKATAKDFQGLVVHYKHERLLEEQEERRRIMEQHKKMVAELINHHLADADWQAMLHNAREAAERGEKEFLILRFPSDLCTDNGRAINVVEEGWQNTLRGEAAEVFARWEHDLKPQGFRLGARVLDYPGGFPGDIGLFLVWGSSQQ